LTARTRRFIAAHGLSRIDQAFRGVQVLRLQLLGAFAALLVFAQPASGTLHFNGRIPRQLKSSPCNLSGPCQAV
jgi:hypothetical protein